jgi:hypothetical protein
MTPVDTAYRPGILTVLEMLKSIVSAVNATASGAGTASVVAIN